MKAESTIVAELQRVKRLLKNGALNAWERAALYGAQQALAWALDRDAANPAQLVPRAQQPERSD